MNVGIKQTTTTNENKSISNLLNDCEGSEAHVREGDDEQGGAGDPQEAVAGGDEGQHEGAN